jgi:Cys-rich repeat protein
MDPMRLFSALPRSVRASLIASLLLLAPSTVRAATWSGGGSTPTISQIFVVDATGETGWPYGQEDVAGDGLTAFAASEQAMDLRSGYAATDSSRFWVRVYVSDTNAAASAVTAYVFLDTDQNAASGGPAAAPAIDPALTTDPSPGGYEYVLGVRGDGTLTGVWEYRSAQAQYAPVSTNPSNTGAEAGRDTDPLLVGEAVHGYVQVMVDLALVGLTPACSSNLFVRSVANGAGDLEAGQTAGCVASDANGDHLPDFVVPPGGCTADAQCPAGGRCQDGTCVVTPSCNTDADCAPADQCVAGSCVARPTGTCSSTAQCGDLVCVGGQCVACTPGGSQCGSGRACSGDGRCMENVVLAPGERVEGGAFHCALVRSTKGHLALGSVILLAGPAMLMRRRRNDKPAVPRSR